LLPFFSTNLARRLGLIGSAAVAAAAMWSIAGCSAATSAAQGDESGRAGFLAKHGAAARSQVTAQVMARAGGARGERGSKGYRGSDLAARTGELHGSTGGLNAGLMLGRATRPARGPEATPLDELLGEGDRPLGNNGLCPPDMASIDDRFCVDRFEASLVEVLGNGEERTFSPYEQVAGRIVRAVSVGHVVPQGYVSGDQAGEACARSGKRLCKPAEWRNACMGPSPATYGYGSTRESGRCNDHGKSAMGGVYGAPPQDRPGAHGSGRSFWATDKMNNPALNQVPGTIAKSGDHAGCTNDYGVYDMVGNLHEWVADPNGTFQGGYYLDTKLNGEGCTYRTTAHSSDYHDYSTGFRCCSDPAP
jgi:formylglycine-generating enzyme